MHLDRLRVVSALPPDGGWRADLGIDRSTTPPRAVLLVRVPPAVSSDAVALSMLARGVDLASRVQHPALRRLLGTGEVGGELVLVEAWREGETLRGLIEAGGPLTPALASRVAVDVAGALHACHTFPAAMGRPLCHGAVRAERILVDEKGEVLLCGMGRPFTDDASPAGDLRGLARLLLESLPPAAGGSPGPLAAVLDQVLVGEGYPTAAAFTEAVAAAVAPADTATLVARLEASQPEGMPAWLGHRRALAQALRAEEGAAADEVASTPAQVQAVSAPAPIAPVPPSEPTSAGPAAVAPPAPLAGEAQDRATPPLPSTAPTAPSLERAGTEHGLPPESDQFVEVTRSAPPRAVPSRASEVVAKLAAWLDHPRAPLVVGAALALVGLGLGLLLGGR